MKTKGTKLLALALSATLGSQGANVKAQTPEKSKSVFACNMNAMTKDQRKRQTQFLTLALHSQRLGAKEVEDGYEFSFPSDAHTLQLVAEWIGNERLCCPFFTYDVRVRTGTEAMVLHISGPEGVKQFIRAELSSLVG